MELFEQIRRARRVNPEVSIRELARSFGTHRRTVRDALASAVPPPRKPVVRPSPVLEPWKPTIVSWLDADREAPREQRHTARRVWIEAWAVGEPTNGFVPNVNVLTDAPQVSVCPSTSTSASTAVLR